MIGRTYLERGAPVVVLIRWGKGGGPRNVLIERADGSRVVRPFRGLRKVPADALDDAAKALRLYGDPDAAPVEMEARP